MEGKHQFMNLENTQTCIFINIECEFINNGS